MAENDAFRVKKRINLKTNTTAGEDPGDIRYDGAGNLQLRDGTGEQTILDESNSVIITNKSIDADNNTVTNLDDSTIKTGAAINAAKIADGSVSNTEFQYLGNVTSDVQSQLDDKAADSDLTDHINDTTAAHAASAVSNTPSGNLSATDVQAALNELQSDVDDRISAPSSTDNAVARYDGTSGAVQDSGVVIDDSNNLLAPADVDVDGVLNLEEQSASPATPSLGDKKLYAKNDGKLYTLDSSGNEIEVGSGAGGGGVLYINEDFETGVTNLVAYADTAQATPVDGTGGSPNVAVTVETASPLIGDQSAQIAKDAANRQGEGVAILSSTVDEAYEDKVHTIEFLWKTDANYTDGDMALFVVHPTTGTVEALNFRTALGEYTNELPASSSTVTRIVSELTPIDPTYRIVLHVASTSATAYEVFVDNIQCGPQRTFNAPIVTEWLPYDLEITADTSNPSKATTPIVDEARWRRVGDTMEIQYRYSHTNNAGASSGTGAYSYSLPNGLQIDLSKVGIGSASSGVANVGGTQVFSTTEGSLAGEVFVRNETELGLFVGSSTEALSAVGSSYAFISETSVQYNFYAKVPIQGWDAGAALGTTQVDQQTEALRYTVTSAQTIETAGSGEVVNFNNQVFDELNSVTTGASWSYTAPTRRKVKVNTKVFLSDASWGVGETAVLYIRKNGTNYALVGYYESEATQTVQVVVGGSASISLDAGDTVDVFLDITRSGNCTIPGSGQQSWVEIEQIPDFSVFGTFPEKNLVQTKYLSSDHTGTASATTLTDLTCSNLNVGKVYTVKMRMVSNSSATSSTAVNLRAIHDSTVKGRCLHDSPDSDSSFMSNFDEFTFKASNTSITFEATLGSTSDTIFGDGSDNETRITIIEHNDLRETSKF